ncbi:glutathione S-transferase [Schizophyllum fasciatum]
MTAQRAYASAADKNEQDGSFQRPASSFRNFIEKGGKFAPERDRYHLYVSYACPWATRALIVRKLKGLEDIIPFTSVSPLMGPDGWPFSRADDPSSAFPAADADPLYGSAHVKDLYFRADPAYAGRFTVPVLWDKQLRTIVNNESAEIVRILNSAFDELMDPARAAADLYPAALRAEIDAVNEWVYAQINNGVYRAGFATTQAAYDKAVAEVFDGLDRAEQILSERAYLAGDSLTEADVRLWVTTIRFDPVYVGHFKCNRRTIRAGYPAINEWQKKLYWTNDAFRASTRFDHIKTHYYWSHPHINPTRIVPSGPVPDIEPL